jgi:hypothetical protein
MKFIKYLFIGSLFSLILLAGMGCKKMLDLDINQNPNDPTNAPLRLLLTSAQLTTPPVFEGVNIDALGFVGILANQGSDAFDLNNSSYNGVWNSFYSGGMKDLDELLKATANGESPHFRGVAQTLKAYFFSMFVDLFGDVPYTEAFRGNAGEANFTPKFDAAKDIYEDLLRLTDSAQINLAKTSPIALSGDIYYGNSTSKWSTLANTVKLYLLMKTRQVRPNAQAEIGAIFTSGKYIKASNGSEDFQFKYNKLSSPEGRHPWYRSAYATGANNFTYFSKQFLIELLDNEDPRQPYYVRRQTSYILNPANPTDRGTIPTYSAYLVLEPSTYNTLFFNKGKTPTKQDSVFLAGFFGRVRGDRTGVPADGAYRAIPGSYPAGGLCDYSYSDAAANIKAITTIVGSGNGVFPFITSNMVQWWELEYQLAYNVGTPRTLFEATIRQSFAYVQRHGLESDPLCPVLSSSAITAYVNLWLARYDAANSNQNKLNVVLKQAWFSNFANGLEIYTTFRRTGLPSTIDLPANRLRQFALRLPYPQVEFNLNPNAAPYVNVIFDRDAIFWDIIKFKF